LAAFLLALVSLLLLNSIDRFYVAEEQLLQDPDFFSNDSHWKNDDANAVSFSGNTLVVSNGGATSHKVFQNVVVDTPGFYKFSFDAGVNNVVPGSEEVWASGNISIIFRDESGERTGSYMIMALSGSQELTPFSKTLLLQSEYRSVDFAIRLYNASGQFLVANPVMSQLQELKMYKIARVLIAVAWIAVLVILVVVALRVASWLQVSLVLGIGAVTIVGVMLPVEMLTDLNQKIATLVPQFFLDKVRELLQQFNFGDEPLNSGAEISKLGHVLAFLCIGLVFGSLYNKIGFHFSVAAIATFALATESLQIMVSGRTPSIADLLLDIGGGLIGLLIIATPLFIYRWFRQWLAIRRHNRRMRRLY